MPIDWTAPTNAYGDVGAGLGIVDGLMEFASDTRGRPSHGEYSLYMASMTFAYAVWENFVEELVIELANRLADPHDGLRPEQVDRKPVREFIESGATTWDLAVHPGWRQRWVDRVTREAVGDAGGGWGINTANVKNTRKIFGRIGIDPFPEEHEQQLERLVKLRGEIAHTARTSENIYKREVGETKQFVADLCQLVDKEARLQCEAWLSS